MLNRSTLSLGTCRKAPLAGAGLLIAAGLIVITGFSGIRAKAQATVSPGFEVASIKRNRITTCCGFPQFLPGGRFRSVADPLEIVLDVAYGLPLKSYRISDGPDW